MASSLEVSTNAMTISRWPTRGVWLGPLAFAISLAGTELLDREHFRLWAVLLLVGAGLLATIAWARNQWSAAFAAGSGAGSSEAASKLERKGSDLAMLAGAVLAFALSHVAFLNAPRATFGVAGSLWLAGMCLLTVAAGVRSLVNSRTSNPDENVLPVWTRWEVAVVALIALLALVLRVWNLRDLPLNIYPDEIMTGTVAERAYLNGATAPPLFSTLWGDIELPALWFAIVAATLKLGGITLAAVRLPAALFGAATVVPFYALLRSVWGRVAAITGASIMAFSAVDVHYSRMALNNITTPFFWTVCFFFLIRGLRTRMPLDWTLAGIAGGVSEHFYYGTRLLPFILIAFAVYLLIVRWRDARRYAAQFGWLTLGYFVGFGPLLTYFATHHGLYYGRGASLMTWNHVPTSWPDFEQMWRTLWPIVRENLLGISTHSAQDIMYYAPLLLKPEAALLVLGVALLVWRWRQPAAFLMLLSGFGVLFVGGTLVLYPNSLPPVPAHWTPAFPAFYTAIALPIAAWIRSTDEFFCEKSRWIAQAATALGVVVLAFANIDFYFRRYYADPATLRAKHYRSSQTLYEEQTLQSRYMASLRSAYRIIVVGHSPYPYDPETTRYLVQGQEYVPASDPEEAKFSMSPGTAKGLAFLFFPGNEQYRAMIRERYPGGIDGEVRNPVGQHLFYTYVVKPE
jgi:4-amino-4-deoxy-L-arabinose transferase-like glycosyltransferase